MTTAAAAELSVRRSLRTVDPNLVASLGRLIALIILMVIMSFVSPVFLGLRNLSTILTNACIMIILGVGETIAIVTRGPDLSIGSVLTITSVLAAIMVKANIWFGWAILAALAFGVLLGVLNGFMIAIVGLPSFISTYGLLWALFGFAYLMLNGYVIYGFDPAFRFIGNGVLFDTVPMPIVVMIVVVAAGIFVMKKTTLGRKLYAVGANPDVAKMSGINVERTTIVAFGISGLLAALAGIVQVARINACQADIGQHYLLPTLATVAMGGTSFAGGQGGVIGTVIGALIMTVVQNAMNLMGVPALWRDAIIGVLIIVTVLTDMFLRKRFERIRRVAEAA